MNTDSIKAEIAGIWSIPAVKMGVGAATYVGGVVLGAKAATITGAVCAVAVVAVGTVTMIDGIADYVAARKSEAQVTEGGEVINGECKRV